ncbi:Viral A-type inclusion protein repeat [Peptoniphilus asaccharolyticus DSM 20463]|uniref:Viral A-type inclusion protein repeat n=1 Tax=Peptoniphilus asaccharolyticus DSM 20463 TaxID=573058 RepID=A0A1W1UCG6_PEPAS|nr:hypothetical protein [Peptoniphilus asaccharolyticus]MBL7576444.1 hypothetical protein [Peptoniphilus asaccharolyticus]SMB78511.1 Viral A-type inclusion protein repeat [Peptoniphilus asaccharolyticus DSM 20463]
MNKLIEQRNKLENQINSLELKKQRLSDEIQRKKDSLEKIKMQIKVDEYEKILRKANEQGIDLQELLGDNKEEKENEVNL